MEVRTTGSGAGWEGSRAGSTVRWEVRKQQEAKEEGEVGQDTRQDQEVRQDQEGRQARK